MESDSPDAAHNGDAPVLDAAEVVGDLPAGEAEDDAIAADEPDADANAEHE